MAFDCDDSDIDSDLDDLSRRPISDLDRAKIHARQLQLWSDEARRRLSGNTPPPPPLTARRRPSSASLQDKDRVNDDDKLKHKDKEEPISPFTTSPGLTSKMASDRRYSASVDRQQSNLSERSRHASALHRVSRSQSAKNLRIRVTPSSSSKSLVSDIESELGQPASVPQSPHNPALQDPKPALPERTLPPTTLPTSLLPDRAEPNALHAAKQRSPQETVAALKLTPTSESSNTSNLGQDDPTANVSRRMSFTRRVRRLSSLKKFLRR